MRPNHASFFERPEGRPFREIIAKPEMLPQYELLSRIELPPVQAVVWQLDPLLASLDESARSFAVQSSGALIGQVLAERGFRVARDDKGKARRGRIRKSKYIRTGTIFEEAPPRRVAKPEDVRRILDELMVTYRSTLEALAK